MRLESCRHRQETGLSAHLVPARRLPGELAKQRRAESPGRTVGGGGTKAGPGRLGAEPQPGPRVQQALGTQCSRAKAVGTNRPLWWGRQAAVPRTLSAGGCHRTGPRPPLQKGPSEPPWSAAGWGASWLLGNGGARAHCPLFPLPFSSKEVPGAGSWQALELGDKAMSHFPALCQPLDFAPPMVSPKRQALPLCLHLLPPGKLDMGSSSTVPPRGS